MTRRLKLALIAALTAHALAWAVTLFFAWEFREDSAGFNPLLLVPIVLTGIPALCAKAEGYSVVIWLCALPLLTFCIIGSFTVGLFYLPGVVLLAARPRIN